MAETLGEKLRQAREERGVSIAEVAEQTRISPHYIELIEQDDYRTLPGGIFNKGFVKSYAKYVGVDESEALQDYSRLISSQTGTDANDDPKTYRPEVLTDDRASSSRLPTIIFAFVILGLLTGGVLLLLNYLQSNPSALTTASNSNSAINANTANVNEVSPTVAATPIVSNEIKLELKPLANVISVRSTVDGKTADDSVTRDNGKTYTGQQSVRIRYYKGFANQVQLTLNGKQITPPAAPARGNAVEFEINKENVSQIIQSGQFSAAAAPANAATAPR